MISIKIFDNIPFVWVLVCLQLLVLMSAEFGFVLGRRTRTRILDSESIRIGPSVTATLALLGFMLAFTFSSVVGNMAERRQLVLEEANVIGTAYLRADLLNAQDREQIKKRLYDYLSLRVELVQNYEDASIPEIILELENIQHELWQVSVESARKNPTPVESLFLQSLNEVIDLHQMRIAAVFYHRMPTILWVSLLGLAILAMVIGGYDAGLIGGKRSAIATLTFSLAFSLILSLIVALDRPGSLISMVTQNSLIDTQLQMK